MGFSNKPNEPSTLGTAWIGSPVSHARYKLSGADVKNTPIEIPSGSSNAVTIHTCSDVALDEIYLYCNNYHTASINLYLGVGSSVETDTIKVAITHGTGLIQVYPGIPHNNGMVLSAWSDREQVAGENSGLHASGFVMRHYLIDPSEPSFGYDGTEG